MELMDRQTDRQTDNDFIGPSVGKGSNNLPRFRFQFKGNVGYTYQR